MRAPRLSLFRRDKWLLTGMHAGLSVSELGVLTILMGCEGGELPQVAVLWTRLQKENAPWGSPPSIGPLLPWSRQGISKAIESLVGRGWVERVGLGWGARPQGLRLLPIVIEAAMPKWWPAMPSAAPLFWETMELESRARAAGAVAAAAKAAEVAAAGISPGATPVAPPAPSSVVIEDRKSEDPRGLAALVGAFRPGLPNLAHERKRLRAAGQGWCVKVEPRRKPKVGRLEDCKHWTARFLGVGGTWAHRIAVADTPGKAVVALIKLFADSNAAAVVDGSRNGVALFFPVTDPRQVSAKFEARGLSEDWNKFPKSEVWRVRLAAGKRGA